MRVRPMVCGALQKHQTTPTAPLACQRLHLAVVSGAFVASRMHQAGGANTLASVLLVAPSLKDPSMHFQANHLLFKPLLAAVAAVVLSTTAHAAPEAPFQSAFTHFSQARSGDSAAVDKAAEEFAALLHTEPGNPVLMAYAGAATALRANTTLLPWKKMSYAEDGMALIDKALALLTPAHNAAVQRQVPGALEVRFVAANTFLAVPGFMNRGARGAKLLGEVLDSPLFAQSPQAFQDAVRQRAAQLKANAS